MALARAKLFEVADVAYRNIVETGIGQALALAGYTEERRLAGLQRLAALQASRERQQEARGRQMVLTRQVVAALRARRLEVTALKQAVRAADLLTGGNLCVRLGLYGRSPKSYSGFVAFAHVLYGAILADDAALEAIGGLGYSQARVAELLQGIADLETLNRQQEKAKGDYQASTLEVQALQKAVVDDLRAVKAVVQTIFAGQAMRGVLESLRLGRM